MDEQKKPPVPSWKGCIGFGILNIVLALLCTKLGHVMVSGTMALLIFIGLAVTLTSIRDDWKAGVKISAIGSGIGLLLQCVAAFLYVYGVLANIAAPLQ